MLDVTPWNYEYTGPNYEWSTDVDQNGIVTVDTHGTYKSSNGGMSPKVALVKITGPGKIRFTTRHISGDLTTDIDPAPRRSGFRVCKRLQDGTATYTSFSFLYILPEYGSVSSAELEITDEDIENGVDYVDLVLWSNGTTNVGKMKFDSYKFTVMAQFVDDIKLNDEFETYKESTKVCNNHAACYIMTYKDGTVRSENGHEISVDYPKSEFAAKFRVITERVQNLDGDDRTKKNIYFFGDSITAGTGTAEVYHQWLSRYTGHACFNWGCGGAGYYREDSSMAYAGNGVQGRGTLVQQTGNNTVIKNMQRLVSEGTDLENVVIAAGTNEFGIALPIDEFRTAVQTTLDYAQEVSSRIFVITPVKRSNGFTPTPAGKVLHDYSEVIIEECENRGIPYIDGYDVPFNSVNQWSKKTYYSEGDGVHPGTAGHKLMAGYLLAKFKAVFA